MADNRQKGITMAKFTSSQLQKSINESLEDLASLIDEAQFSQEIQSYLDTIANFTTTASITYC